ncbi:unnamed protein product [Pleuronectes platessa]|uniref:Uncharacterized protein n=1 Tax=Pleuronectes platessa TaxID=8262 RepID=A0A9N7Z3A4_PLEPL|nr:unnamed protein product [Pleuronectes platessa]
MARSPPCRPSTPTGRLPTAGLQVVNPLTALKWAGLEGREASENALQRARGERCVESRGVLAAHSPCWSVVNMVIHETGRMASTSADLMASPRSRRFSDDETDGKQFPPRNEAFVSQHVEAKEFVDLMGSVVEDLLSLNVRPQRPGLLLLTCHPSMLKYQPLHSVPF